MIIRFKADNGVVGKEIRDVKNIYVNGDLMYLKYKDEKLSISSPHYVSLASIRSYNNRIEIEED